MKRRPDNDADASLPSNDKVRNKWSYTSTPLTRHHVVSRNLTFTFALNKGHCLKCIYCLLCTGHTDILKTVPSLSHEYTSTIQQFIQSITIYRVSQEECARLREGVPYVKIRRYNPKHLYPKLNGYRDNVQRKVWSSGGSTHCTCQLTSLSMSVLECGVISRQFSWFSSECFCAV
jgi:hypothetical protein